MRELLKPVPDLLDTAGSGSKSLAQTAGQLRAVRTTGDGRVLMTSGVQPWE